MQADEQYLIWSMEHDAWWRPASRGYTQSLAAAGRYDEAEARAIVAKANIVKCHECMIPLSCLVTIDGDANDR